MEKKGIPLDWDKLINNDDPPPELVVTSAGPPPPSAENRHRTVDMDGEERTGLSHLTDAELTDKIARLKRSLAGLIGARLPDGGQKLRASIKLHEDELELRKRRPRFAKEVDGCKSHSWSSGVPDDFEPQASPFESSSQSTFASCFMNKLEARHADSKRSAFHKELGALNPCYNKRTLNRKFSQRRQRRELPSQAPYRLDKGERIVKAERKRKDSSSPHFSEENFASRFSKMTKVSQSQSSDDTKHVNGEAVVLLDEEEPDATKVTEQVDQEVERKATKIYYPSRIDPESVEVHCSDMESLAPESYLSSTIMNFYIRYLRNTKPRGAADDYHFFNTYFYKKLKEALLDKNKNEASFIKLRRWWKGVNIFEKAYIFLPIHDDHHWSLVIICLPDKEDHLGPNLLHLDSLGLHCSKSLFRTIKEFLVQEWRFLTQGEVPAPSIADKIWEHLPRRINENFVLVPQQRNDYDCGLFVLFFIERFIEDVRERFKKEDLMKFGRRWFKPEEASRLRMKIRSILEEEFKNATED